MNVFIEFLNQTNLVNLVLNSNQYQIKDVNVEEASIEILTEDNDFNGFKLLFQDFLLIKSSFKRLKQNSKLENGVFESVFRFNIRKFRVEILRDSVSTTTNLNSLSEIKCVSCSQSLMNQNNNTHKFSVLNMPENDLEELAENFFCHMHDHSHSHSDDEHQEHDLTNELNPLRNTDKLRKSILNSSTYLILNSNHIILESIDLKNEFDISCSKCSHVIGFRNSRRINDYYLWKSEILIDSQKSHFDIFARLQQGRYLFETKEPNPKSLAIWIISDNLKFQHFNIESTTNLNNPIKISLLDNQTSSKKILFRLFDQIGLKPNDPGYNILFDFRNDVNVTDFKISKYHFESIQNMLARSKDNLCESLKDSTDFDTAII